MEATALTCGAESEVDELLKGESSTCRLGIFKLEGILEA